MFYFVLLLIFKSSVKLTLIFESTGITNFELMNEEQYQTVVPVAHRENILDIWHQKCPIAFGEILLIYCYIEAGF